MNQKNNTQHTTIIVLKINVDTFVCNYGHMRFFFIHINLIAILYQCRKLSDKILTYKLMLFCWFFLLVYVLFDKANVMIVTYI